MTCPWFRCPSCAAPLLSLSLLFACSEAPSAPSPTLETPEVQDEESEPFDAAALFRGLTPEKACSLMRNARFYTPAWKPLEGGPLYGCASPAVDVETTKIPFDDFSNTVAYSVEGDAESVRSLRLRLSIASKPSAAMGHTKLMEHASVLFLKLARRKLPREIHAALVAGTPAEAEARIELEVEGILIRVAPEEAPRGRDYDLSVTFQLPEVST